MKAPLHQPGHCLPITMDFRTIPYLPHDDQTLRKLAAAGMSLHLFAEALIGCTDIGTAELHDATDILTTQIEQALVHDDWRDIVLRLVTDPQRAALANGCTAASFCGQSWPDVVRLAGDRAAAAAHPGVEPTVVLRLAAVHAYRSGWSWRGMLDQIA